MDKEEWKRRFAARCVEVGYEDEAGAKQFAEDCVDQWFEEKEYSPEEAADEEIEDSN